MRTGAPLLIPLLSVGLICCQLALVQAGQGCPFDDGSCQEYCSQQGCNMGYCGHFAWIQCICRKCGDEWSWYDKVHYNPDKTVNQTELDSLKLNATNPLILTNSSTDQQLASANSSFRGANEPAQQQHQRATLTTLLIPDLSDSSKLDLNDIPDENSDKFLDYLAKNHERLVQATSSSSSSSRDGLSQGARQQLNGPDHGTSDETDSATGSLSVDDEPVEIEISSNNNNNQPTTTDSTSSASSSQTSPSPSTPSPSPPLSSTGSSTSQSQVPTSQQQQKSPLVRLLHMAVDDQLFDTNEQ